MELTGHTFAGYEIIAKLGEGGFGSVYKARQPALNRFVAIKILASHLAADADFVARFKREATLAASFNHPNLVLVYAAGESDGSQFMAMEFVEGTTLGQHIEHHGRLKPREALAITVYVAQALQYAWNKSRLIHRDIKPDNIFVSVAGEIKVGDLGLAKNVGQSTAGMTATGMMMGSPHYISPEQAGAKKDIDFRADIYSLGCTLYQMLTGQTPYEGNDPMVVMGLHVNAPPPAMFKVWPQCPMPLALLVGKMLKKNPRERHASYEELIAELTAVHEKLTAAQTASAAPPTGTITFLFTDIEGSTQLWEKHPQAMPVALERHNQLLRRTMESHGGFVFKTVGDAFCVAFASAPNAMGAALAAQRALAAEPWGATGPLRVRMALHTGAAEERGGDYFGPTLNRVARVLAAGHGGQILLSQATEQLVRDHLTEGVSLGDLGERSLKNLTRTERIFQINLPDLPTEFPTLRASAAGPATPTSKGAAEAGRPVWIYAAAGAAVLVVVLVAGLLLWSPWKERGASSVTPVAERASVRTEAADRTLARSATFSTDAALKQSGSVFTNSVGAEMVYIPPGEFMLGSTKEEQAWAVANGLKEVFVNREGEAPRKTRIRDGFWLGRTEVTVGQWKEFMAATGYKTEAEKKGYVDVSARKGQQGRVDGLSWRDPGFGSPPQDNHPVCCVSWNDAMAFCGWLTERERKAGRLAAGQVVRLPTEAEWEYACRAGTQTKFWWGESERDNKGRLNGTGKDDGFEFVAPVDSYGERGRNKFDLADMLGNVYEWCLDEYDAKQAHEECYKGNPYARVLRGGAFNNDPGFNRSAYRGSSPPAHSNSSRGFRVVMDADQSGTTAAAASTSRSVDDVWKDAINLLPLIDPAKDAVEGKWMLENGALRCVTDATKRGWACMEIPYQPPEEYDFRIVFVPKKSTGMIFQVLRGGGRTFQLCIGGMKPGTTGRFLGFEIINNKSAAENPSGVLLKPDLEIGRLCTSLVQVRKDGVKSFLDGRLITEWKTDYQDMTMFNSRRLRDDQLLGIGDTGGAVFHRIEVREVTGKGTFTRGAPSSSAAPITSRESRITPADAAFCAEVLALPAEQQVARVAAKLKELNPGFDGKVETVIANNKVVELKFCTVDVANIAPVNALQNLRSLTCVGKYSLKGCLEDLSPLRGLKLEDFRCLYNPVRDLNPLKGMPLTCLFITRALVRDLAPLNGMPLTKLNLNGTPIADLSPLIGAPLQILYCNGSRVSDLLPLKEMRLTSLSVDSARVTNLDALRGMPLEELGCDFVPNRDTEILRSIKTLKTINQLPAAEFWKQVEAGKIPRLRSTTGPSGETPSDDGAISKPAVPMKDAGILAPAETRVAALTTNPKAGEVCTLALGGSTTLELVAIPPGEFLMGSTKEEQAWAMANGTKEENVKCEGEPPRKAAIKQGFWLGRTEVTVGQWKQFVKETGYVTDGEKKGESYVYQGLGKPYAPMKGKSWRDPNFGFEPQDDHAVSCISWNDAKAFCEWLDGREQQAGRLAHGYVVRLPTEAEWEYACRAGRQTKFWWGDSKEDGKGRLNWGGKDDAHEFVAPVDGFGERGRNRFGLADMLGNIYEWCLDEYDATEAHADLWTGNPGGRVLRGGSFHVDPARCRAATRYSHHPSNSYCYYGFRVCAGAVP